MGASARDEVWPEENQVEIDFDVLRAAKAARNAEIRSGNVNVSFTEPYYYYPPGEERRITIMGNPNLGNVRTIMLGARNPEIDLLLILLMMSYPNVLSYGLTSFV